MQNVINKNQIHDKKLLVICPTRGRSEQIKKFLDSFDKNSSHKNTGILFCIDDDDLQLANYQKLLGSEWAYMVDRRKTITQIFNNVVNEICHGYQYYMPSNDDFIFQTFGWDLKLMQKIKDNGGWGIAYGDDAIQSENMPTTSVISGNLIRVLGWLQMPMLTHLYGDNIWKAIGESLGRLFYCPDVRIQHEHPANGSTKADEVHKRTNSEQMYKVDSKAFDIWFKTRAKHDVDKIVRAILKEKKFDKTIALCMIISDTEKYETLKRCLSSVKYWVDEINLVFNFQKFKKPFFENRMLENLTNDKFHNVTTKYVKWTNFSDMRNNSIKMAEHKVHHKDFILWLDADDYLDNPWTLKDMLLKIPEADYFKCTVLSYTPRKTNEIIKQNRLFRNGQGYEFRNLVHEDISFSMVEKGAKCANSNIIVHHLGNQNKEDVKRKNKRNLKLVMEDLKRPTAHNLTYYAAVNALMIEDGYDNHLKAMILVDECFEKFKMGDEDPLTAKMWVLRGLCCMYCNQFDAAKQSFKKALSISDHPEAAINLSEIYMMRQNWEKAIEILTKIYEIDEVRIANLPIDMKEIQKILLSRLGRCHDNRIQDLQKIENTVKKRMEDDTDDGYKKRVENFDKNMMKSLEMSEKCYAESLSLEPNQLQIGDRLAFIMAMKGKINQANYVYCSLVNIFPDYAVGWLNLAMTEIRNQRYQTGLLFLTKAYSIDRKNPDIKHNLINCQKAINAGKKK